MLGMPRPGSWPFRASTVCSAREEAEKDIDADAIPAGVKSCRRATAAAEEACPLGTANELDLLASCIAPGIIIGAVVAAALWLLASPG